jgi:radical SAM/Cys-rich protein
MAIKQVSKSLTAKGHPFSDNRYQLQVLNKADALHSPFSTALHSAGYAALLPVRVEVLQVNVGRLCNQSCSHCHVDAGPDRKEVMSRQVLEQCLDAIAQYHIPRVDITGGAPELNPHFRWFVAACRKLGCRIMDRCNLTIIVSNPKYADLPAFFAAHQVELMCSLPHFSALRTDHQRGEGVFEDSIRALRLLNEVGYGKENTTLQLHLIYNPSGAFLPGDQLALEAEFKRQLRRKYDIVFNHLYAITNLPINRFLDFLIESGSYHEYMETLVTAFNPMTLDQLMCRNTISVDWQGFLYDCDFNQMLGLPLASPIQHISEFDPAVLAQRKIVVNQHCYGCTAGAGSSCGGSVL